MERWHGGLEQQFFTCFSFSMPSQGKWQKNQIKPWTKLIDLAKKPIFTERPF
jgi:hypothetical protein